MLSTDARVFSPSSDVWHRTAGYGALFDELALVVYTKAGSGVLAQRLGERVTLTPTNSISRPWYFADAYRCGVAIIARWIASGKRPIAITCQDPFETGLVGYLIARRFNIPLQLQVHTDVASPWFKRQGPLNRFRVLLARFLLRRADGVRAVSARVQQSLVTRFGVLPERIAVLPIHVAVAAASPASDRADIRRRYARFDFIILMAGRLTREKNVSLAIRAFSDVVRSYPNTLLLSVGDGPEQEHLKSQVANLKIENNISFEPWADDLAPYCGAADLFMLTSNYEGYGRTPLEALAQGTPVLMTDVGIAGELVRDRVHGLVVPVNSRSALARGITFFLEHREFLPAPLPPGASEAEYLARYRDLLTQLAHSPSMAKA